jgi:hydrogenase-4 component A
MCALVCPFGAIRLSGTSIAGVAGIREETPVFPKGTSDTIAWEIGVYAAAVKCDLCSFSEAGPACVCACPTGSAVLMSGDAQSAGLASRRQKAAVEGAVMAGNSLIFGSE